MGYYALKAAVYSIEIRYSSGVITGFRDSLKSLKSLVIITPELNEMHTDGGYGSEDNDKKLEQLEVTQVTTAVRGRESGIEKKIEQVGQSPDLYTVECPYQKAVSAPTKQRHKIRFETKVCMLCLLKEKCQVFKNKGRYYFTHEDYLQNKRNRNIMNIPGERRKIRPNVEALMKEFKARAPGGKAKVRGLFKTSLFAFNAGIAINFGRIFRYIVENDLVNGPFSSIASIFHKTLRNIHRIFSKTGVFESNFRHFLFYTKYFSKKSIIRSLNFNSF